jgi:hypothetical protein
MPLLVPWLVLAAEAAIAAAAAAVATLVVTWLADEMRGA